MDLMDLDPVRSPDAMDWTPTGPHRRNLKRRAAELARKYRDLPSKRQKLMMLYDDSKHLQIECPMPGAWPLGKPDYPNPPSSPLTSPLPVRQTEMETNMSPYNPNPKGHPYRSMPGTYHDTFDVPYRWVATGIQLDDPTDIWSRITCKTNKWIREPIPEDELRSHDLSTDSQMAWHDSGPKDPDELAYQTSPSAIRRFRRRYPIDMQKVRRTRAERKREAQEAQAAQEALKAKQESEKVSASRVKPPTSPAPKSYTKIINHRVRHASAVVDAGDISAKVAPLALTSGQLVELPAGQPGIANINATTTSAGQTTLLTSFADLESSRLTRRIRSAGAYDMGSGRNNLPSQLQEYGTAAALPGNAPEESSKAQNQEKNAKSPDRTSAEESGLPFTDSSPASVHSRDSVTFSALPEKFSKILQISQKKQKELDERAKREAAEEEAKRQRKEKERQEREAEKAAAEAKRLKEEKEAEIAAAEAKKKEEELKKRSQSILAQPEKEWQQKIDQVMAVKNMNKEVTSGLLRKDFDTLVPNDRDSLPWLNDEIVNNYLNLACQTRLGKTGYTKKSGQIPAYHVFSTHFYQQYQNKGWGGVERWFSRAKIHGTRLLSVEQILIPLNLGNHWTLLSISGTKRTIEYYDSMDSHKEKESHEEFCRWARILLAATLDDAYDQDEWKTIHVKSQQQNNGCDCGVFVCINGLALLQDREPFKAFDVSEMKFARRSVAAALLGKGIELALG